jgi:hypothetical protein
MRLCKPSADGYQTQFNCEPDKTVLDVFFWSDGFFQPNPSIRT